MFILILSVIMFCIYTYVYYIKVIKHHNSTSKFSIKNRLFKLSLIAGGAIVPYGEPLEPEDFIYEAPTTIVELTDAELNELLQILFQEIGNSNLISVELLQALGLYSDTVVSLLTNLGYFIF